MRHQVTNHRLLLAALIVSGAALSLWPKVGLSDELVTPMLPAFETGTPNGALPPPGLYFSQTFDSLSGHVNDGTGNSIGVYAKTYESISSLLWTSPYHIFGASYGAAIVATYEHKMVDARLLGGPQLRSFGFFNPIIVPAILSWHLGGPWFTSTALTVYVPTGRYDVVDGATDSLTSMANHFWTFEPSVGLSYLTRKWDLSALLSYDINTVNPITHYYSGHMAYLDLTALRTTGKFSYGFVGEYSRQLTSDRIRGALVAGGKKVQHVMPGAMVAYALPHGMSASLRYLQDTDAHNDLSFSTVFLTLSAKL